MSYTPRNPNGQATMANSEPVVLASDQSAIPVTDNSGSLTVDNGGTFAVQAAQSGTWNVTNVSGTVSLPTGASTLAEQQTQTTALQLIDDTVYTDGTGTPSKGIAVMGTDGTNPQIISTNSTGHVNIADGGNTITVDGTVAVTGVSTAANQTTIIGHVDGIEGLLTTIDADTGNLPTIKTNTDFGTVVGGGTETGALRVTIANNSTGVVSVDDNGSSLTVDGTVTANLAAGTNNIGDVDVASIAAGTNYIGKVRLTDGTTDTDIRDLTNSNALNVAIVDGSGDQITSFGGGTQYAVDAALGSTPTGTVALAKVDAALSAVTPVDGDAESLRVDANGALHMNMSYKLDSTNDSISAVQSGTWNVGTVTAVTGITNALPAGTNNIGDVDVLSIVPGTGATSLGKAEDAVHANGDTGVAILSRRIDTVASSAGTSGDYATVNTDAVGKLWVTGTVLEDVAHSAGEQLSPTGVRRIDTPASSAGSSADWATLDASAEGALWATLTPTTTGGCSIFRSIDLDESEEEIKATAGNLYGYYFANTAATARYLKFYNATAASVTVGTTTPVLTFYLPPTSAGHVGLPFPIGFGTAITAAATTGVADSDTGAPGSNEIILNAYYK